MDILEKIGRTANKTYKTTAEKASGIVEKAKIKYEIYNDKEKIDDLYRKIGKKVFEKHTTEQGSTDGDVVQSYCDEIDEISERIKENGDELLRLKHKKSCNNCHAEIEYEYMFCPRCGDLQENATEKSSEENAHVYENNEYKGDQNNDVEVVTE